MGRLAGVMGDSPHHKAQVEDKSPKRHDIIQWKVLPIKYHVLCYPLCAEIKCFMYLCQKTKETHPNTTAEHELLVLLCKTVLISQYLNIYFVSI